LVDCLLSVQVATADQRWGGIHIPLLYTAALLPQDAQLLESAQQHRRPGITAGNGLFELHVSVAGAVLQAAVALGAAAMVQPGRCASPAMGLLGGTAAPSSWVERPPVLCSDFDRLGCMCGLQVLHVQLTAAEHAAGDNVLPYRVAMCHHCGKFEQLPRLRSSSAAWQQQQH
jgi:hypothetical protein